MTESPEDYELFHYGVKGMKWGVRKSDKSSGGDSYGSRYKAIRNRPLEKRTIRTKKGYEFHVKEDRTPVPAALLIAASTKLREKNLNFKSYTFKDSSGKNIGEAQFDRVSKDELNLVWLGVNPNARGKGVASSAFDLAVDKGREMGVKRITLEVPGNAPDAKHIYTKAGFKDRGLYKDSTVDDAWGGLTLMTMDIDQVRHADQSSDDDDIYEVMVRMFEHKLKVARGIKHADDSSDYELFHYGVKGMKWGVRKDEESSEVAKLKGELKDFSKNRKDSKKAYVKSQHFGFTTPSTEAIRKLDEANIDLKASKRRLSDQKLYESAMRASPSKSRTKLESKYLERGYSDRDAKIAAERYIRTRRIAVAAAVTTVAVAGTVAARKYNINNVDKILKSGTKLQHISADNTDSVRDAFYSAVTPGDKVRYRGQFGQHVINNGGKPYVKTVETISEIRQASPKTARGVLSDMLGDEGNRKRFLETLESNPSPPEYMKIAQRHLKDGRVSKEVYDAFNTHLVLHDETHQPLIDKFYSGLKDKGFNAILDSNDMKFSGYNAQKPLITFGSEGLVKVTDVAELTKKTMTSDYNTTLVSDAKKSLGKMAVVGTTAILAKSAATRVASNVSDSRAIQKYKAEHPNTKLNNSEILYAVKKSQLNE